MSEDKKALLNLNDLAGFSKPIEKLIECINNGVSNSFNFFFSKKITEATTHEITSIKSALAGTDSKVTITNKNGTVVDFSTEHEKTILNYVLNKENKKMKNTLDVIQNTASILKDKDNVSNDPVNKDWLTRFFNIIEDVSTEEMQNLWSKILANEIEKPNSYSLRTLETLRNISSNEALLFTKFSNVCFYVFGSKVLSTIDHSKFLSLFDISLQDVQLLTELNLINSSLFYELKPYTEFRLITNNCDKTILIENKTSKEVLLPVHTLTTIGQEISMLIDNSFELLLAQNMSKYFKEQGDISVYIADVNQHDLTFSNDKIEVENYNLLNSNNIRLSQKCTSLTF